MRFLYAAVMLSWALTSGAGCGLLLGGFEGVEEGDAFGRRADATVADASAPDRTAADASIPDRAAADLHASDASPVDAQPGDSARPDTAGADTGPADRPTLDTGLADLAPVDAAPRELTGVEGPPADVPALDTGGVMPWRCGTPEVLREDFYTIDADEWVFQQDNADITTMSGTLELHLQDIVPDEGLASIASRAAYQLRDGAVWVELDTSGDHGAIETVLRYHIDDIQYALVKRIGTDVYYEVHIDDADVGGVRNLLDQLTGMRIQQGSGNISLDYLDGSGIWQQLWTEAGPTVLPPGRLIVAASKPAGTVLAGEGVVRVHQLNLPLDDTTYEIVPYCRAESLVDLFDGSRDAWWRQTLDADTVGSIRVNPTEETLWMGLSSDTGALAYLSREAFTLRGSMVQVELPTFLASEATARAGIVLLPLCRSDPQIALLRSPGDDFYYGTTDPELTAGQFAGGASWLRITMGDDATEFWLSEDGLDFTKVSETGSSFPDAPFFLGLTLSDDGPASGAHSVTFKHFNAGP